MPLHITPEMVETSYELLRLTPPFKGWKLPHADEVLFSILKTKDRHGDYTFDAGKHHIRISYRRHKTLHALTMTLAHEMVHMRDQITGTHAEHGATFNKLADTVCKYHGFDRGQF